MGSFLLSPVIDLKHLIRPFQIGQTIAERFEIIREIGEGGMGVVYEALDLKRGLRIAIKAAKPGFQRLLSPELEGALTVRHPNVCRVNEIHTAQTDLGEVDFLTMELLEGETLSEYLRVRGKLTEVEALQIARQLCAGLSEAHRSGVIHRDLKSSNVILCHPPDGQLRVVITDFGLAGGPTEGEDLVGTPGYMAPELWRGGKTSKASDIYALGIIFYEIVANPQWRAPEPTDSLVPDTAGLSKPWARTIVRCVDPSPAARPRDVDAVLASLDKRRSKRNMLVAFLLLALIGLSYSQVHAWSLSHIAPPPNVRLVVLPLSKSGSPSNVSGGILQDVSERIARLRSESRAVSVTSPSDALKVLVRTPNDAVAMHATHILQTSMEQAGADILVHGSVIDLKTQTHLRDFSARYSPSTFGAIPAALAGEVSSALQLEGSVGADVLSLPATVPYDQALYILAQDGQHAEKAITLFQEAARLDPRSPLPLAGLVEAEVRRFRSTKDSTLLNAANGFLQAAQVLNPDSVVVHLATGRLNEASGQYEKAREEYARVQVIEPRNVDALVRIGNVYDKLDIPGSAVAAYRGAIELDPLAWKPYEYFGAFYYGRGKYAEAAEQFRKAIERSPGMYLGYSNLAAALEQVGQYDEAERALLSSLKLQETAAGLLNMGTLLASKHRDGEAVTYYERALALNPHAYLYVLNLADSNRRLGHDVSARKEYQRGMGLALAELTENPRSAEARAYVGYFSARLGDRRRAEDEIRQALRLSQSDNLIFRAVITYEALGLRNRALEILPGAAPQFLRRLEREPDLVAFSRDSRFKELIDGKKEIGK
jgi:serine/threonine protein kinase/tetratricopeptide (TPR) repeat protein